MKPIAIIAISITVLMMVFVYVKIIDLQISIKYEVQDPRAMNKGGGDIDAKEKQLNEFVFWLRFFEGYLLLNLIMACVLLYDSRKIKK